MQKELVNNLSKIAANIIMIRASEQCFVVLVERLRWLETKR